MAHECILDLRPLTKATGVTVDDVAKRLIDYGFHAPTVSFPVAGTLMVEPTESEDLAELDRFCDAMIAIRAEIDEVASGRWAVEDSPLRGAPHTAAALVSATGSGPTTGTTAVFPAGTDAGKYWPPVARINQAYGDRNLVLFVPAARGLRHLTPARRRRRAAPAKPGRAGRTHAHAASARPAAGSGDADDESAHGVEHGLVRCPVWRRWTVSQLAVDHVV